MTGLERILKVFRLADSTDLEEGLAAYFHYRQTLTSIGDAYGYPLERTAAAFAALSPNNDYIGNLRSLVTALIAHRDGIPVEEFTVSTYRACARRAYLYLDGVPFLEHCRGPKTRNFYTNIISPWLPHYVTIDGHMFSVWQGERMTMKAAAVARLDYERVANDFRRAAYALGILPNQTQAVIWFAWKRIHNVVFEKQLSLLRLSDQWRLLLTPEEIEPFRPTRKGVAA